MRSLFISFLFFFSIILDISLPDLLLSLPPSLSLLQTAIPIPSPVFGVIEEIFVPDGEKVEAGNQLCKIKITSK